MTASTTSNAAARATLDAALHSLLPGDAETWLLRTCLWSGGDGRGAWREFQAREQDLPALFRMDTGGLKRLGPLLAAALSRNDAEAPPELLTVLRTAWVREELRAEAYQGILGEVVGALNAAAVPFLVLKGAALGPALYGEPALRHAHDIDLLVPPEEAERAAVAAAAADFHPMPPPHPDTATADWALLLQHPSGLPLQLLRRLFRVSHYRSDWDSLWERSEPSAALAGAATLSPADHLLHACGHAAYCPGRSSLLWACDAYLLIARQPGLDWDIFLAATRQARIELPLSTLLSYLAHELRAPVPEPVLDALRAAPISSSLTRDLALYGARQRRGGGIGLLLHGAPGRGARLRLARWLLFPSADYLRWTRGGAGSSALPLQYLLRPLRLIVTRLRSRTRPAPASR